ncbi:hypothetical protein [Palleronia pelagia]|nr:hypothetical protein [Palleronia pelagia]
MPPAANVDRAAQVATERYFAASRTALISRIKRYVDWLGSREAARASAREGQRRFSVLRLLFNRVLTHLDLYSDALSQRGERDTGVQLAGLDVLAADAMALPGYFESPPLICYLDRGIGAAIRRARTRLPGGGKNPSAIIRVPRERMIGTGVASSLVHEVGHQAAALLGLVNSLRTRLRKHIATLTSTEAQIWQWFERWISEVIADFWSVARLGITSTLGLVGVVSLPRAFVFRIGSDDPHPIPWIRIFLSAEIGARLFPDPQWDRLARLWAALYPAPPTDTPEGRLLNDIRARLPAFVDFLVGHRSPLLGGRSLEQVMRPSARNPEALRRHAQSWLDRPNRVLSAPPAFAVAVLGQARMDGALSPAAERRVLRKLLDHWALQRAIHPPGRDGGTIRQLIPAT